jgi:hypothetical protein
MELQLKNAIAREIYEETGWLLKSKKRLTYIGSDIYTNVFLLDITYKQYSEINDLIRVKNRCIYREVSNIRFIKEECILKNKHRLYKLDNCIFNSKSANAWKIYKKIIPSHPYFNKNHVTAIIRYENSQNLYEYLMCEETRWINTSDDINTKLQNWDFNKKTKEYVSIYNKYISDFNLNSSKTLEDIQKETDEYIENIVKLNFKYNIDKKGGHIRINSGKAGFIKGHVENYD